jgi:hypothetical protein
MVIIGMVLLGAFSFCCNGSEQQKLYEPIIIYNYAPYPIEVRLVFVDQFDLFDLSEPRETPPLKMPAVEPGKYDMVTCAIAKALKQTKDHNEKYWVGFTLAFLTVGWDVETIAKTDAGKIGFSSFFTGNFTGIPVDELTISGKEFGVFFKEVIDNERIRIYPMVATYTKSFPGKTVCSQPKAAH